MKPYLLAIRDVLLFTLGISLVFGYMELAKLISHDSILIFLGIMLSPVAVIIIFSIAQDYKKELKNEARKLSGKKKSKAYKGVK